MDMGRYKVLYLFNLPHPHPSITRFFVQHLVDIVHDSIFYEFEYHVLNI